MQYAIKIENMAPTGSPILMDNLKQIIPELEASKRSFFLTSDLSAYGYASFVLTQMPYFTSLEVCTEVTATEQNSDGEWIQKWEVTPKTFANAEEEAALIAINLSAAKLSKITEVKATFVMDSEKPRVDTGLGYFVDGGRYNLQDFESAKTLGSTQIRDADNVIQTVTSVDLDAIILAIKTNGAAMYAAKWAKEAAINACITQAELDAIVL